MINIFGKMVNIIKVNIKIINQMEKVLNIIQMEIYYMKVILLMENLMEKENTIMIMVCILLENIKMV